MPTPSYGAEFLATGTAQPCVVAPDGIVTYELNVTGSGAVAATVVIEGSNCGGRGGAWTVIATFSASGTNAAVDSVVVQHSWLSIRARCTAISGTGASALLAASETREG